MAERIVEVEWEDSNTSHGWQQETDLPKPVINTSIGQVVRDDKDGILLAETFVRPPMQEGQRPYGCCTAIPRSAILKVRELKYARSRR